MDEVVRDEQFTDSYRAFIRSMCSYWAPGQNEYLAGEIIQQWSLRQSLRREIRGLEREVMKHDAVLGELMYRKKAELCTTGRGGRWCAWLKQQKISRSTADRLVIQHGEFFGLDDQLSHRESKEPLEGHVSQAAFRTRDRVESSLPSAKSRLAFVTCIADLLGLDVELDDAGLIHVSLPPLLDDPGFVDVAPPMLQVRDDGTVGPVNYELRE